METTPSRDERNRRTGAALGVIAAAGGLIVLGVVLDPPLGTVFLVSAVVLAAAGFVAAVRQAGRS